MSFDNTDDCSSLSADEFKTSSESNMKLSVTKTTHGIKVKPNAC